MKTKKPLVSVVMPVFNAELFVARAIESIQQQTLKDYEFIIIDDASFDKTAMIVKQYAKKDPRIRFYRNKRNLQHARTLNICVKLAKTDYIARMDADDISLARRLETQFMFLQRNPRVAIVGNDILIIDLEGKIIGKRTYPPTSAQLKRIMFLYSPFAHPTVMFRKKIFQKLGGYDPKMAPCEDIELWFRLGKENEFASIQRILLKYRLYFSSVSHHSVQKTELLGFKIKLRAVKEYGYRPSRYDIFYNMLQFLTLWVMPNKMRIDLYNFLRGRKII